jgi:hypothetical protein
LESHLIPYIENHYDDGYFYILYDNHFSHSSKYVEEWIKDNLGDPQQILIKQPPRSPDLNPDEHVGGMIKRKVQMRRPIINNADDLWKATLEEHQLLGQNRQFFINLISSMPNTVANRPGMTGTIPEWASLSRVPAKK